jgi:hypothetical protein
MEYRTLVYEPVDQGTVCAIVAKDVRPAARAVAEGLVRAGLTESNESLRTVVALTSRLAVGSGGGIVSLEHTGDRLIAAGLLGLELQRRGANVIARPEGPQYEALVGTTVSAELTGALAVGLTLSGDTLAVTLGYATLDKDADVRLQKTTLLGEAAEPLRRVIGMFRLATEPRAAGIAAREILAWILWPAIATQNEQSARLGEALKRWRSGASPVLSALVLAPPAIAAVCSRGADIDGVTTAFVAINSDLFNRLVLVS